MADRSPFPGMDPWLENHWGDVHHEVISSVRRQVRAQLPAGLFAAVEETVVYIDAAWERSDFRPDVGVFGELAGGRPGMGAGGVAAVADPIRLLVPTEPVTETHVEIRELATGNPLVTAIEVLSPKNKRDARGRAAHIRKRDGYHAVDANVVEVDLLRGGEHLIEVPLEQVRPDLITPYKCAVRHRRGASDMAAVNYYGLPLRERLSRVRVPLRAGDVDVVIDLQRCVDDAYAEGGYEIRIDYARPADPPLSPGDAAWAAGCVATAGR